MSLTTAYSVYAIDIDGTTIEGIKDNTASQGINTLSLATDGRPAPAHSSVMGQQASVNLTSNDIKAVIDAIGLYGKLFASSDSASFWLQQRQNGGARSAGATHKRATMNQGVAVITSIQASQGQDATISVTIYVDSDGTNAPYVITENISLSALTGGDVAWTVGKIVVNGITINGIQNVTINTGVQPMRLMGDGDVQNTFTSIDIAPTVQANTNDMDSLTDFDPTGEAIASSTVIYLRKKAKGGANVADATAEHISITINDGMVYGGDFGASSGQAASNNLNIIATDDDVNDPLVFNTATAIT